MFETRLRPPAGAVLLALLAGCGGGPEPTPAWHRRRARRRRRWSGRARSASSRAARRGDRRCSSSGSTAPTGSCSSPGSRRGRCRTSPACAGEGAWGELETETPPLSPLLWTTMMTGVSPLEHGVLDFIRFRPGDGEREPITSDEREVPALWNAATWAGKRVAVFGLWATYPAEAVDGRPRLRPPVRLPQHRGRAACGRGLPPGMAAARDGRAARALARDRPRGAPGVSALALTRRVRGARRVRAPLRPPGLGAAPDPDRNDALRPPLPGRLAGARAGRRRPLPAGDRFDRPRLRALRAAAPGVGLGRRLRNATRGSPSATSARSTTSSAAATSSRAPPAAPW